MEEQENEQQTLEDIEECLNNIFNNLQISFEINYDTLFNEEMYIDIYTILFPQFADQIENIKYLSSETG